MVQAQRDAVSHVRARPAGGRDRVRDLQRGQLHPLAGRGGEQAWRIRGGACDYGSSVDDQLHSAPGSQAIPLAAPPPGTTWNQVGSMQAPQAPSILGPERTNGVWNTCFAHSPNGALLAAFNLWAESTAAPSGEVYRHLAIDVPTQAYRTASRLDDQGPVQFAGYKYQSYTPSAAQVLIVVRGPQGKLGAFATTMRWVGSDWRYAFPPGGQLSLQVIPDLTGYVQWSAF